MKLSTLFSKLENSPAFNIFRERVPNAFFCAGFFILRIKQDVYEYSLDFKDEKKIYTFKIPEMGDDRISLLEDEILDSKKTLEKIETSEIKEIQTDIEDLPIFVEKELQIHGVSNELEEIIAVLQNMDGKMIWHLTCMCEGFCIVTIQINPKTRELISFNRRSITDFVKKA